MPSVNMASIMRKANGYLKTPEGRNRVQEAADKKILGGFDFFTSSKSSVNIYHAAYLFIDTLRAEIQSSVGSNYSGGRISQEAANEFMNIECGDPEKVKDGVYKIPVYFADSLHRHSVAPQRYRGADNIIDLLNAGFETKSGKSIRGNWNGKQICTLPYRNGAHFIESAIRVFMRDYAGKYNVTGIEPSGEYRM